MVGQVVEANEDTQPRTSMMMSLKRSWFTKSAAVIVEVTSLTTNQVHVLHENTTLNHTFARTGIFVVSASASGDQMENCERERSKSKWARFVSTLISPIWNWGEKTNRPICPESKSWFALSRLWICLIRLGCVLEIVGKIVACRKYRRLSTAEQKAQFSLVLCVDSGMGFWG